MYKAALKKQSSTHQAPPFQLPFQDFYSRGLFEASQAYVCPLEYHDIDDADLLESVAMYCMYVGK